MAQIPLIQDIISQAEPYQFDQIGAALLSRPQTIDHYTQWINDGFHAKMSYLKEHLPFKENPKSLNDQVNSAIVIGKKYFPHPHSKKFFKSLRLALYADGEDYHIWFRQQLKDFCQTLLQKFPQDVFLPMTDSSPVLERDLAKKAGLGWVGKNTCLIHPKEGSLFFIGEIYTSLELPSPLVTIPDLCGNCNRCIEACPTKALIEPQKLDANRCISYWTIESKELPPLELRTQFGDHFFGCDLCQTVCPWNQKLFKNQLQVQPLIPLTNDERMDLIEDLDYLLTSSGKKLNKHLKGSPLLRAGPKGLKRNALIVAGNHHLTELKPIIEKYIDDPYLGPLALWVLQTKF